MAEFRASIIVDRKKNKIGYDEIRSRILCFGWLELFWLVLNQDNQQIRDGVLPRMTLIGGVPAQALSMLKFLFTEYFSSASPMNRLYLAKVFLAVAHNWGALVYRDSIAAEIAVDVMVCTTDSLTAIEQRYYRAGLILLEELLIQHDSNPDGTQLLRKYVMLKYLLA
jgi:hypothetical protein